MPIEFSELTKREEKEIDEVLPGPKMRLRGSGLIIPVRANPNQLLTADGQPIHKPPQITPKKQ